MNRHQPHELWWLQAKSDHDVFIRLRRWGVKPCHQLHYLQMATEKLGKAYFWRSGTPPRRTHAAFVRFMRFLGHIRGAERERAASVLAFSRYQDLRSWINSVLPLAYELQRLAPDLAHDGPNPEYPWPPSAPRYVPAEFEFDVWKQLTETGKGRQLVQVIDITIRRFAELP